MAKKNEDTPIRVLIVLGSLEIGGAEKHVASLAVLLRSHTIDVSICALSSSGALQKSLEKSGIELFYPQSGRSFDLLSNVKFVRAGVSYLRSIWILLRAYYFVRPHIVHFFLPGAYIVGGFTSLLIPGLVRVMSRRSLNLYQQGKPVSTSLEKFLHKRMNKISGNSQAVISELIDEGVRKEKAVLIYNGVDVDCAPIYQISPEIGEVLKIICVANLIPYKGHVDLFRALSSLRGDVQWQLTCVGRDDGYKHVLEKLADSLGIRNRITFAGAQPDPRPYMAKADIGVNCSHQEGFSNAVLEYMSCGLAIIATKVGGNPEAIRKGIDGIIVPAKCPERIADAVKQMQDFDFRKRLGKSARARAREKFSLEQCTEGYVRLYKNLITGQ